MLLLMIIINKSICSKRNFRSSEEEMSKKIKYDYTTNSSNTEYSESLDKYAPNLYQSLPLASISREESLKSKKHSINIEITYDEVVEAILKVDPEFSFIFEKSPEACTSQEMYPNEKTSFNIQSKDHLLSSTEVSQNEKTTNLYQNNDHQNISLKATNQDSEDSFESDSKESSDSDELQEDDNEFIIVENEELSMTGIASENNENSCGKDNILSSTNPQISVSNNNEISFNKTFNRNTKYNNEITVELSKIIKIKIVEATKAFEDNFFFRLNKVYFFLTKTLFFDLVFWSEKSQDNENSRSFQEITQFFQLYIKNKSLEENLIKIIEERKEETNFNDSIKNFNTLFKMFMEKIKYLISTKRKNYFQIKTTDKHGNKKIDINKYILMQMTKLKKDKKTSILFLLFPELDYFFQEITSLDKFNDCFRLCHLVFSIVIMKFYYMRDTLKSTVLEGSQITQWLITDSDIIMTFIFETRCVLAFFGFNLFTDRSKQKILLSRAFIAFLKVTKMRVSEDTSIFYGNFLTIKDEQGTKLFDNFVKAKKDYKYYEIISFFDQEINIFYKINSTNQTETERFKNNVVLNNIKRKAENSKKDLRELTTVFIDYFLQ
ncbi:hypothetical protein TUBRATIS_28840 [Tubulinosema ratisbonensis]|uniref:Uncharacterized protein n=1 Tax=Tubulinosema ratisbonensis TaxID=291195 RepID=A0A437AHQ1_9MICR|nr:hypothetical protein TUBRATIS_28840 [Tubulinosema ratisbonensis]